MDVAAPRLTPDGRIGVVDVTYQEDFKALEPEDFKTCRKPRSRCAAASCRSGRRHADFAGQLAGLIGIGVGIDYALIVVTRYRAEHARGIDREEALLPAMDTAGRTVFFAGCTVIIALFGLLLLGLSFLDGVAVASAIAVGLTMLAALTLLPALLSRSGKGIDRLHPPLPGQKRRQAAAKAKAEAVGVPGYSPAWGRRARPAGHDHARGLRPHRRRLRRGHERLVAARGAGLHHARLSGRLPGRRAGRRRGWSARCRTWRSSGSRGLRATQRRSACVARRPTRGGWT